MRPLPARLVGAALGLSAAMGVFIGGAVHVSALDNGLARTPYMGWNTYYGLGSRFNEQTIQSVSDAIVNRGLKAAGYQYVNLDDCWMDGRDASGKLRWNTSKFPSGIPALADYVHSKGLKIGIYSSPGTRTCAGFEGSYGHEAQDARTWAAWASIT